MLKRIEIFLARPRAPLWLGLFAVAICLPALRFGLQADDHLFPWKLEQGAPRWSLFEIEAAKLHEARARGFMVWWSSPHLHGRFLRPLASLSHAVDFTLWPTAAWWMRAINALIYGATVWLAALLYRRLAPSAAIAGLAGLMFALDDGHAFSAGWISGRNTLLAGLFSLLALWLHVQARERVARLESAAALQWASVGSVALALCSAEAGAWSLTLLASYALALESGGLTARLRTIAPALAVAVIWAITYVALDCGFRGSSFYRDPSSPAHALSQGVLDLPVWFWAMFGLGDFALAILQPALWVRVGCALASLPLLWLLWPGLRSSRASRFFALAFALTLLPGLCTQPSGRVLLGASFGALGWVACSIVTARAESSARGRWTARILLTIHVAFAGLLFTLALGSTQPFANGTARILKKVEAGREVMIVQAPVELLSNYVLLTADLRANATSAPKSVQHLYTGSSALWAQRIDARTLEIEVERGWGYVPIERIFCTPEDVPHTGSELRLPAFTARVLTSTEDGMPQRVRFSFPTPLESPERQWLTWQQNRVVAWTPPAVGQRVRIAPLSFFASLR